MGLVHLHELHEEYPYRRLFSLLVDSGYSGYCLAEIPGSEDPVTVLRYYKTLFQTLVDLARTART